MRKEIESIQYRYDECKIYRTCDLNPPILTVILPCRRDSYPFGDLHKQVPIKYKACKQSIRTLSSLVQFHPFSTMMFFFVGNCCKSPMSIVSEMPRFSFVSADIRRQTLSAINFSLLVSFCFQ